MSDALPVHLIVSGAIQVAAAAGAVIVVVQKGDAARGALVIKTNDLAGQFALYQQIYDGTRRMMQPLIPPTTDEAMVDARIHKMRHADPDCWVLEVEDRAGRLWFDAYLD